MLSTISMLHYFIHLFDLETFVNATQLIVCPYSCGVFPIKGPLIYEKSYFHPRHNRQALPVIPVSINHASLVSSSPLYNRSEKLSAVIYSFHYTSEHRAFVGIQSTS